MFPSTAPIAQRTTARPAGGLRWWHIYLMFVGWTLFSVFVFSSYSTLGDSASYLSGAYDDDIRAARTRVLSYIANAVFAAMGSELLAHLVFSLFAASGVAYLVTQARLHGRYRWPFLAIVLVPNFGIWASVVGRESVFVGLLGFFLGAVLSYYRRPRFHLALLALICVAGMTFIRSPYGIGMALFLLMFLLYRSGPKIGASTGVHALFFTLAALFVLVCAWSPMDDYITGEVLPEARSYFTIYSETTRTWINMDTTAELFSSLWWSLPLALIGPTPAEVMARPVMLPFLLSGMVVFGSLLHSLSLALRAPRGMARKILLLGWLPAVVLILVAYVPFGIYNPGSAIRYASCFLLFLVFPPMLLSTIHAGAPIQRMRVPRRAAQGVVASPELR